MVLLNRNICICFSLWKTRQSGLETKKGHEASAGPTFTKFSALLGRPQFEYCKSYAGADRLLISSRL